MGWRVWRDQMRWLEGWQWRIIYFPEGGEVLAGQRSPVLTFLLLSCGLCFNSFRDKSIIQHQKWGAPETQTLNTVVFFSGENPIWPEIWVPSLFLPAPNILVPSLHPPPAHLFGLLQPECSFFWESLISWLQFYNLMIESFLSKPNLES